MGYISTATFVTWVFDNCGFHICDEDMAGIEAALDGQVNYRISRENFMLAIEVSQEEEDEVKRRSLNASGRFNA